MTLKTTFRHKNTIKVLAIKLLFSEFVEFKCEANQEITPG